VSYSIDVNILLYASDQSNPRHTAATIFMQERISDSELFCVTWPTIMSYLRISTHPRIFSDPLPPDQALNNIESILSLPHVRVLSEDEGFLSIYREVASRFPVRGNLVPDAHLAALLRQHGVRRLYTNDGDFKKFDFLDVRDPFV
jgi:hypothetical protein